MVVHVTLEQNISLHKQHQHCRYGLKVIFQSSMVDSSHTLLRIHFETFLKNLDCGKEGKRGQWMWRYQFGDIISVGGPWSQQHSESLVALSRSFCAALRTVSRPLMTARIVIRHKEQLVSNQCRWELGKIIQQSFVGNPTGNYC